MRQIPKIFIDGEYGTTGLGIRKRLERLPVKVCSIPIEQRHNIHTRLAMMKQVDLVVLCLPDEASKEIVSALHENLNNQVPLILDASTAFRTNPEWVYGFAELNKDQKEKIAKAKKVANPGCYASGSIAILFPLISKGLVRPSYPITINAVSGFSGGGKKMIAAYQNGQDAPPFELYGLNLKHKHLPEIVYYTGLEQEPIFVPSVGNFSQGMIVSIPFFTDMLTNNVGVEEIKWCLHEHYRHSEVVSFIDDECKTLAVDRLVQTDKMELRVHTNATQDKFIVTAIFDNLGKGASGAAIQNIQLMLGIT
ncbi:N-acetyl-gamma-glutamyl-phosphate reductase [Commensalibacter sp. Nvir]|uniref:N-acetyl-gamma-glutamyl-phosphate reductase n=1 Tax=Commensalibacter sp. Nvir TaxID=3069817 RepID=UPI002D2AFFE5|nr:N-acetyl-gamma-glutamyl-phosphate reductase [Commensalibacter sp. Nvir]